VSQISTTGKVQQQNEPSDDDLLANESLRIKKPSRVEFV